MKLKTILEETKYIRDPKTGKVKQVQYSTNKSDKEILRSMEKQKKVDERSQKTQDKQHMQQMMKEYKLREAEKKAKRRAESRKKWEPVKQALKTSSQASRETMKDTGSLTLNLFSGTGSSGSKKSKKTNPKYVIRDGVAYPVASQKKKKGKKRSKDEMDFNMKDFGMPDWKDIMK